MIKIENVEVYGWKAAIRGLRNPMNSWDKSDSYATHIENPETQNTAEFQFFVGENDLALMKKLVKAGPDHSKFMRFITVTFDVIAPRYWWAEFSTYKVGTVANSCSTMHRIHAKEFTLDDFSHEHLLPGGKDTLEEFIEWLNVCRGFFIETNDKKYWWQMIQLLPQSYNQRRTVLLNYAVLRNMYHARKEHKLDEWRDFCTWIKTLPYSELITEV